MDAFANLPGDVLVAILVRLPARSIARCRQVCRTWRSAISHPSFDAVHAERPAAVVKVTAIDEVYDVVMLKYVRGDLRPTTQTRTSVVVDLVRGRWHHRHHHDNVSHINPKPLTRALFLRPSSVLGSWDGVVCIKPRTTTVGWPSRPPHPKQYVLWNPLTMACATVWPPLGAIGEIIGGYSHPSTRRFHLVQASGKTLGGLMAPRTFRIFRVGDDNALWREMPLSLQDQEEDNDNPKAVELNISIDVHHARCIRLHGNLHWLVQWGSEPMTTLRVLTFDTTHEKFRLMEAPPGTRSRDADNLTNARLGVLSGGKLCAFIVQPSTRSMDVWVLNDYQHVPLPRISSWQLKERIGLVLPDRSDWSREFCVDTEVEVVEGEEIFLRHDDRIDAYNLGCKEWRMVNVSRGSRTVMHRESVLQPEVSFGAASRSLSRSPTVDTNGHIRYSL